MAFNFYQTLYYQNVIKIDWCTMQVQYSLSDPQGFSPIDR